MGYRKPRRFSSYPLPALGAAFLTSLLAAYAFSADLYIGVLYWPDPATMMLLLPGLLILAVPVLLFALIAVWPLAFVAAEIASRIARRVERRFDWAVWLVTGAICGAPALFLYSFPLGLGQTMLGPLLLNGALLGAACAALVRKFAGPQIDDPATSLEDEGAHNAV